jgi:predicted nucleotidyltransferase
MEKPKDKDFVETVEGLLFCVVGYLHPPDRYTAYLKYVPSEGGKWSREETRYTRVLPFYHVSQVENTYGFLSENHPEYLFECPVRNITLSAVPEDRIKRYYRPRERLKGIVEEGPKDELEWKLTDLITILTGLSGLKTEDFGVTGSMLTANHSPEFSDMDITVYGQEASGRIKETILETREEESLIQPFNSSKKEVWSMSRTKRFPLDFEGLMEFAERRWNYGVFRDTYFSMHPVRTDEEIAEVYGDNTYWCMGEVSGRAKVACNSESIYLPAIYKVEDVVTDVSQGDEVTEIVSYEGLFCDMFEEGETVEFGGVLESVEGNQSHLRVVVGGAGSRPSYIKRVR